MATLAPLANDPRVLRTKLSTTNTLSPPTGGGSNLPTFPQTRIPQPSTAAPGQPVTQGAQPVVQSPAMTPQEPMTTGGSMAPLAPPTAPNIGLAGGGGQMPLQAPTAVPGLPQPGGQIPLQAPMATPAPTTPTALSPRQQSAVPLSALGGYIEQQLGSPSRFDLPVVQNAFNFLAGDLDRQAAARNEQLRADAAARGVFYGSPLTTSQGDLATELQRGKGSLATQLLLNQAQTAGQDMNSAISNAMQFGQNQLGAQQFAAQMGLGALGQGFQGGADPNAAMNAIIALATGQPPQGGNGIVDFLGALGPLALIPFLV